MRPGTCLLHARWACRSSLACNQPQLILQHLGLPGTAAPLLLQLLSGNSSSGNSSSQRSHSSAPSNPSNYSVACSSSNSSSSTSSDEGHLPYLAHAAEARQQMHVPPWHRACSSSSSMLCTSISSRHWHMHTLCRTFNTSLGCGEASTSSNAAPRTSSNPGTATNSTGTSISSSPAVAKLQVPPAVAAGAAAAGGAAAKVAQATAKQASKLVKLVQSTSLSEATWLQLASSWQSHGAAITAATAAAATAGVYQLAAAIAGQFVDMADPTAFWSCLSASAAAVSVAGLQIRSSFTVDPERVYRITMRKLNRHAGLQEVMGSPLAGSDVRLELVTQGTLFVQETLLPKRRAPRLHLMFQVTGPTKTGVVSVVAKKAFGSKYAFKTLMVELPDKTVTSRAAAAAGTAAMMKAEAAKAANTTTTTSSSSSSVSQSSSSQEGSGADTAAAVSPARIYIIGAPAGSTTNSSSSSSNPRHMSPTSLLEDLKDPLLYALKHNLVGYEAEDETEGQLAWSKPQHDPDQTTWWDDTKRASNLLACRTYTAARKAGAAAVNAASKASAKLKAQAASSQKQAAAAASSSGDGAAAAQAAGAASKPAAAGSGSGTDGSSSSSSATGNASGTPGTQRASVSSSKSTKKDVR